MPKIRSRIGVNGFNFRKCCHKPNQQDLSSLVGTKSPKHGSIVQTTFFCWQSTLITEGFDHITHTQIRRSSSFNPKTFKSIACRKFIYIGKFGQSSPSLHVDLVVWRFFTIQVVITNLAVLGDVYRNSKLRPKKNMSFLPTVLHPTFQRWFRVSEKLQSQSQTGLLYVAYGRIPPSFWCLWEYLPWYSNGSPFGHAPWKIKRVCTQGWDHWVGMGRYQHQLWNFSCAVLCPT